METLERLGGKTTAVYFNITLKKPEIRKERKKIFVTFFLFLTSLVILFQVIVVAKRLVLSPLPPRKKSESLLLKHNDDFLESASLNSFCY